MITIMFQYDCHREWADPTAEQAVYASEWLRAEIALELQASRSRTHFDERGDIFGKRREHEHPITPVVSDNESRRGRHRSPGTSSSRGKPRRDDYRSRSSSRSQPRSRHARGSGKGRRPQSASRISCSRPSSFSPGGRRFSQSRHPGDRPSRTPNGSRRYLETRRWFRQPRRYSHGEQRSLL